MIMNHTHGVAQWRCDHPACKAAATRYRKQWTYERLQGKTRRIPPDAVVLHIATLRGQGWSYRAIAAEAGVSVQSVSRLGRSQQTITQKIAQKILAVDPMTLPSKASKQTTEPMVPRVGTVRRLQALMRIAWSPEEIGRRAGHGRNWVYNLLHQQGQWVTRSTHDKVARIFDELKNTRGPAERTARHAKKMGFPGPLQWDDIDLDLEPDPELVLRRVKGSSLVREWIEEVEDDTVHDDEYDEVVVLRKLAGKKTRRLSHAEVIEVVRRARAYGWSESKIEALGLKPERYKDIA